MCPAGIPVVPLLTMPTSCGEPLEVGLGVDGWGEPGNFLTGEHVISKTATLPEMSGCEHLDFSPRIGVEPEGSAGSTPTGLNVDVRVPQEGADNPVGLSEANTRDAVVALPAGVQVSPSAADGLGACSLEQIGLHSAGEPSCPAASKIAVVHGRTPALEGELTGAVYLAAPQNFTGFPENPFSSLLAVYMVVEEPVRGILVKLAGRITADPVTGQLTAAFEDVPQLPFSELRLEFFGSDRAPLATPALCGTYTTESSFTPWTAGEPVDASLVAHPQGSFQITSGPGGSGCSDPLPFAPSLLAGTTDINAGAFSDLSTTLSREDGQQDVQQLTLHFPPGVSGILKGVPLCGEAQANQGTCPAGSLIGETTVSVGLGSDPFTITVGKVYITGPYEGAPFGLSIVNTATAGPFTLQEGRPVVVRARIAVDPNTAALTVTTNTPAQGYAIPSILEGIPLQIKHVNVNVNRPGFAFNPTSCNAMRITGTILSAEGASSAVSVPFQVANCQALGFRPRFSVSTQANTSKHSGASLTVKGAFTAGNANVHSVGVLLPKQLPARLTTIQQACPEAAFDSNPAGCPAGSDIGTATATTPVLSAPVTGPVYLVSHGGAAFPDVVAILQGEGVTVELTGSIDIKKGVTSSDFATVPDVPISSFVLTLPEGPHSGLAAVVPAKAKGSLCGQKLTMPFTITGQNGAQIKQNVKIQVTGCPKAKAKTKKPRRKRKKS